MRIAMMVLGAVCALFFLSGAASAGEYKWDGSRLVEVVDVQPSKQLVTIPPGYHAHTRTDGTVIVHGDENVGNAAAHEGIERPWPKTGKPGQKVIADEVFYSALTADPCPNGVCPVSRRVSVATAPSASVQVSEVQSKKGVLAKIADNIRERRDNRRVKLFGGGCPCR